MVLNKSIMFSFVLHAAIVTAAVALNGRGAYDRAPVVGPIMVSLFNGISEDPGSGSNKREYKKPAAGKKTEDKEKTVKEQIPDAPVSADARKKSATVSGEKTAGIESGTQTVQENPVSQGGGAGKQDLVSFTGGYGGGVPSGTAVTGKPGAVSDYSLIRSAIEKAKTYPYLARKRKIEGRVTTEFMINSKGYPERISIVESSGYEILDSAVLGIIKKAAPFPKVEGQILIPITFSLKEN